jgi:hypothetical protein
LNTDLSKAYELLGVKPGVSSRELKAAHRDLAKVWHPDRFVHDPRLQEKAQEKLKEINEAYELVSSGKTPRPAPVETVHVATPKRTAPRGGSWKWAVVPVFLFAAVFAVTTKVLLERRSQVQAQPQVETVQIEPATQPEPGPRSEVARRPNRNAQPVPQENSASIDAPAPTPALATVTVLIDPESRLLAKADCPVRSRMTYPSGSQPSAYCNINHTPPQKDSRIKSLKKKILQ